MGCDIHTLIEYKHPCEDEYLGFASPNLTGDYILFALLAGVRATWVKEHMNLELEALFSPRGFPDDTAYLSDEAKDYHSHSWLGTEELKQVLEAYIRILGPSTKVYYSEYEFEYGVELKATIKAMEALPNARLVFCFDN